MSPLSEQAIRFSTLGRRAKAPAITELMNAELGNSQLLSLAAGFTDNAVLPEELVADAVCHLRSRSATTEYLQYGMNAGRLRLREAIARFLARYPGERAERIDAEHMLITHGSQQALYLAVQVLCDPGDVMLVEQPSYFVFLDLLAGLGVRAVSIPARDDGRLDIAGLAQLLDGMTRDGKVERVKGLYSMGYFANPSGRCVTLQEKRELGQWLRTLPITVPVLEDGAYRELFFEEPYAAPSTLSLPEFDGIPGLYLGTFSKPFSSGLRVGYAISSELSLLRKMAQVKGHHDFGTANFSQAVIETVLLEGAYPDYLNDLRSHYRRKMGWLIEILEYEGLSEAGWRWTPPQGGMLCWLRGPVGLNTDMGSEFCRACIDNGVLYVPGSLCFAGAFPRNCIRLSVGSLDEKRLKEAARRFCQVAHQHASSAEAASEFSARS